VTIDGFSNGNNFLPGEKYRVAINSYRGNGGGNHLTTGSGIPSDLLSNRIVWSTDIDLRYYLMQSLALKDTLHAVAEKNWHIIPESWVTVASETDKDLFD
jgi:2',3'-cyclic-nucleotide 2'-phosphodiesterase/3'-nucleotidase